MSVSFDRLKPVKCRATLIRDQWSKVQTWQSGNNGSMYQSPSGRKDSTFNRYLSWSEYNAGTAYIADFTGSGTVYDALVPSSRQYGATGTSEVFDYLPNGVIPGSDWSDANNLSQIVGLLRPVKLTDWMTKKEQKMVSRQYRGYVGDFVLGDKSKMVDGYIPIINDTARYADWIVPVIDWFVTDSSGQRKTGRRLAVWYPYTVSSAVRTGIIDVGPIYMGVSQNVNLESAPWYAMINAPFYAGEQYDKPTAQGSATSTECDGNFRAGYLSWSWGSTGNRPNIYVHCVHNPYVTLYISRDDTPTFTERNSYDTVKGFFDVGIPFLDGVYTVSSNIPDERIVAYPDAQSVIDYFADFGITITTDPEIAGNPPPETDVINPTNPSDPIPSYPDNGTDSVEIDSGFITPSSFGGACVYTPVTIRDFLRWMTDGTVSITNWQRLFANPADVVQGISMYNLDLTKHDSGRVRYNAQTNILGVVGDIPNYSILDGYNNIVDGGTLNLMAYYGNYADFTSMTYQCFIPFVGFITLRASDVVNRTLHLQYAVDFATGSAIAFLKSDEKLIYTSPCTVAGKIPLSISDKNSQTINNTLAVLGGIGGIISGVASGNPSGAVESGMRAIGGLQLQTNYATRGSLSGVNIYKLIPAFVERTRYDLFLPSGEQKYLGAKYQSWMGAPSTQFDTLKNCVDDNGYVQSDYTVLPSCSATEQEKDEIRALIQQGIYIS